MKRWNWTRYIVEEGVKEVGRREEQADESQTKGNGIDPRNDLPDRATDLKTRECVSTNGREVCGCGEG